MIKRQNSRLFKSGQDQHKNNHAINGKFKTCFSSSPSLFHKSEYLDNAGIRNVSNFSKQHETSNSQIFNITTILKQSMNRMFNNLLHQYIIRIPQLLSTTDNEEILVKSYSKGKGINNAKIKINSQGPKVSPKQYPRLQQWQLNSRKSQDLVFPHPQQEHSVHYSQNSSTQNMQKKYIGKGKSFRKEKNQIKKYSIYGKTKAHNNMVNLKTLQENITQQKCQPIMLQSQKLSNLDPVYEKNKQIKELMEEDGILLGKLIENCGIRRNLQWEIRTYLDQCQRPIPGKISKQANKDEKENIQPYQQVRTFRPLIQSISLIESIGTEQTQAQENF